MCLFKFILFPYTMLFRSRSNGTSVVHVLTVLSLAGVFRLLQGSRAAIALPLLKWILDKIQELKLNLHADEDSANLNQQTNIDRKSTRLNSSHRCISYAFF